MIFIVIFSEFAKMCSNEYIFVFTLANMDFCGYVRSGRWVGEVTQTMYACAKKKTTEGDWSCEPISFGEALQTLFSLNH